MTRKNKSLAPKAFIAAGIFLFIALTIHAQTEEKLSPLQQMELYKTQIDSAKKEKNASEIASIYGKRVTLCRENSTFENELPENLCEYGLWSIYAGNHQTAINALVELLDMYDRPDDKSLFVLKARANNLLGMTYFFLKKWDNALIHYQKTLEMAIELQNDLGISIAENNIGNIYQKKGNYQQAIVHYLHCLQLQEEIGDRETICNTYHNLATCYSESGNFTESLAYFDLALNLAREIDDREIETLCLIGLARYQALEKHQFAEAVKLIAQAEVTAKEAGYNQVLSEVYQARSIIDEKRGDFVSALEYHKQYKALSDELFNDQSTNQLHEYEVRYQTAEKQLEIERQQAEIKQHRTRQFIYIGGLIAAALLLIMLVYAVILRTRRNRALAEMNAIKDKFFSIISHDLKNPAIAQRDSLQLLAENADKLDANTVSSYYHQLLKSADGLVNLLKNLLNWAQIQTGRDVYRPSTFDLMSALQSDIEVIKSMSACKDVVFEASAPSVAILTADENMIVTVVRNLLANAVKFTAKDGRVILDISPSNRNAMNEFSTTYIVTVADTGVGMTPDQIPNLFRIDRKQSRAGTAGEEGTGLGLIVCKDFLEKNGSTLHIESEAGKGSRFWFELSG